MTEITNFRQSRQSPNTFNFGNNVDRNKSATKSKVHIVGRVYFRLCHHCVLALSLRSLFLNNEKTTDCRSLQSWNNGHKLSLFLLVTDASTLSSLALLRIMTNLQRLEILYNATEVTRKK